MLREAGLLGSEEESKEDKEMRALWKHFDSDGSGCAGQPAATRLCCSCLPPLLLVGISLSDSGHPSVLRLLLMLPVPLLPLLPYTHEF